MWKRRKELVFEKAVSCFDSLAAFRRVNVKGTERLAQQAVDANVRRFFFMSSVKVKWIRRLPQYHLPELPSINGPKGI